MIFHVVISPSTLIRITYMPWGWFDKSIWFDSNMVVVLKTDFPVLAKISRNPLSIGDSLCISTRNRPLVGFG